MTPEQLEQAMRSDPESLVALLEKADEQQRRRAASVALAWNKVYWSDPLAKVIQGVSRETLWRNIPLALLGTASLSELKSNKAMLVDKALALRVLSQRQPAWLQQWAQWSLEQNPRNGGFIRDLQRAELIDRPEDTAYAMGIIAAPHAVGAYQFLSEQPEVLDHLTLLFQVEGSAEFSLAAVDKYTSEERQWGTGLRKLCEQGVISRDWLLAASLRALNLGFSAFRAGWFSRFHESLQPTLGERAEHISLVYPLLGSPVSATASFALKILDKVSKKHPLEPELLLSHMMPVWMLPQKGPVLTGLKILARTPPNTAWTSHLMQAATHPQADVQSRALQLLSDYEPQPRGELLAQLQELIPTLEPSVLKEYADWLSPTCGVAGSECRETQATVELENRLEERLEACSDPDELFALAARILEDPQPAHDVERLLDGLLRFPGRDSAHAPALRKRVAQRLQQDNLWGRLAAVLSTWLGHPVEVAVAKEPVCLETFLQQRLSEIQRCLASPSSRWAGLYSLPDRIDGGLSIRTLAQRLRQHPDPPLWDFAQALLRLSAEDTDWTVGDFEGISGSAIAVLKWTAGESNIGLLKRWTTPKIWLSAAQGRALSAQPLNWAFSVRVRSHTVANKTYHHRTLRLENSVTEEAGLCWMDQTQDVNALRWQALISPARRERFQLLGIVEIANNIDWWEADWSNRVYLETLLRQDASWGRTSAFLAALGLACKEPSERGLAIDAVARSLENGQLPARLLGEALAETASTGMITPGRWVKSLNELRRFIAPAPLHETLERFFAMVNSDFDSRPLLAPLLEVAVELNRPITDERARTHLVALGCKGKAGRVASQILALGPEPARASERALDQSRDR